MITMKTSRKAIRRQQQMGAALQLERIQHHLNGFQLKHETPAQTVKRLVEENQALNAKERKDTSVSDQ